MDLSLSFITLIVACITCIMLFSHLVSGVKRHKRQPGETVPEAAGSRPIIGHMLLFAGSQPLYKVLGSMADKYGPIFTIKIGSHPFLVVSTPDMAKECLITNGKAFAGRPKSMLAELMGYNYAKFALGSYGPFWRDMTRITALELGPYRRHQTLSHLRVSEVALSINDIYRRWTKVDDHKGSCDCTIMVDMTQWFHDLIVTFVLKMIFGDRFGPGKETGERFKKVTRRFVELMHTFVPSDVFPGLRWLDLGGYEKKMKKTAKEMDLLMDGWLQECKNKKLNSSKDDQMLMARLLSRVTEEMKEDVHGFTTDTIVKATCVSIYAGGTDATIVTLTWALSLLMNNPLVLRKAQHEVDEHVGRDRKVEERDLNNLVYLQAILKETMRLYPSVPFLLPHEAIEDCIVGGYSVPKGTRLLINAWKIQNDPQIWVDPFEFNPERFLASDDKNVIDIRGQHFKLLPFGSGRRMCIGINLALDDMMLILASIIHAFEFQNPSNDQIDMSLRSKGVSLKITPLELLVTPRLPSDLY